MPACIVQRHLPRLKRNAGPDERLCPGTDCPDKNQQLAPHGGDDFSLIFAGRHEPLIFLVQPVLRLPCNLLNFFADAFLPLAQRRTNPGTETIGPGRLDYHSSQMSVAGLGDGSAPHPPRPRGADLSPSRGAPNRRALGAGAGRSRSYPPVYRHSISNCPMGVRLEIPPHVKVW